MTFKVQRRMCATCIYRPDTPLDLEKLEDDVRDPYVGFRGHRVCHHSNDVCCRGFWVAHVKGEPGNFEVSVCYGEPGISWGWFGPRKIQIEGGGFADAKARAEKIAEALNAAGFDPQPSE